GRAREGVTLARTLGEPFSLAFALFMETVVHRMRRDWGPERERAAEVIALRDVHDFALWRGLGRLYHGLARAMAGEGASALAEVAEGLALVAGTGNRSGAPGFLSGLAAVQSAAGPRDEARGPTRGRLGVGGEGGPHLLAATP